MVSPTSRGEVGREDVQKAVYNTRRRYTLYYLNDSGGVASVDELVERIASWESGEPPESVPAGKRESVYSSLYQTHIPNLERMGLVRHDAIQRKVSRTEAGGRVSLHCAADTHPTTAPKVALGLAGLLLVVVALGRAGVISGRFLLDVGTASAVGLFLVVLWQVRRSAAWARRYRQRGPDYIVALSDD